MPRVIKHLKNTLYVEEADGSISKYRREIPSPKRVKQPRTLQRPRTVRRPRVVTQPESSSVPIANRVELKECRVVLKRTNVEAYISNQRVNEEGARGHSQNPDMAVAVLNDGCHEIGFG